MEGNHISKKIKYSHLYEKIERCSPLPGTTPPVEKQAFLSDPHTVEVIGVTFSGGQVTIEIYKAKRWCRSWS
jgi:hypothetical protein